MSPIVVGAITGLVLSATTGFLITGWLFHRYQALTPATWRGESWGRHGAAMLLQAFAGAGLGWLCMLVGAPPADTVLLGLIAAAGIPVLACILVLALYVNWHRGVVAGLVVEWALFVGLVLTACAYAGHPR
jgi:hypothetical protein